MAITQLTFVNDALALLGEVPMNTLDHGHPMVPVALAALAGETTRVQAHKWWFNTEYPTLTPQAGSGEILLPNDTLAADPVQSHIQAAVRGNRLYNTSTQTYVWDRPLRVRLHREVPFEEAPISARAYIAARALRVFSRGYDADPRKLADIKEDERETYALLRSEHIRAVQANILHGNPTLARMSEVTGQRYGHSRILVPRP